MNNFEFKNMIMGDDGKPIFVELSDEQKKRIPDYIEVLRTRSFRKGSLNRGYNKTFAGTR